MLPRQCTEAGAASLHRGVFLGRVQEQVELMLYFLMTGTIEIGRKVHSVICVLVFSEKKIHYEVPLKVSDDNTRNVDFFDCSVREVALEA